MRRKNFSTRTLTGKAKDMKNPILKLTFVVVTLLICGCYSPRKTAHTQYELARNKQSDERELMLTDGRIYIGMSDVKFAKLWEYPGDVWIDRSTSQYGVTEWWKYDLFCEPASPVNRAKYHFCFEDGILTYWSEN